MTGQYEKFFHGYLPCSTFKSILIEDIDMMGKIGIYEVVEEDLHSAN
jgi:Na+-transporting NADH:ubiquinone oxidoreductase subunit A